MGERDKNNRLVQAIIEALKEIEEGLRKEQLGAGSLSSPRRHYERALQILMAALDTKREETKTIVLERP